MNGKITWMTLGLLLVWFAAGCDREQSISDDPETQMTDQEALEAMFLEDVDLEEADIWDSGETDDGGGGGLDEPITPVHWARLGRRTNTIVNVVIYGDSAATITRTLSFDGNFRIIADTTDTSFTYIDKPMFNELVRKARAVRVANTPFPLRNWRIVAVTPEVLRSDAPNPYTIWPVHAELYRNGDEGLELVYAIDDPMETWLNRENLPTLYPNEEITVFVTANRADAFGVLHPRVFRYGNGGRLPLRDDGEYPDEIAGDGIYSGSYNSGERVGVFMAGLDLIDEMTLFDSEAPYDAGGWGVPYRVIPPEL